MRHRRLSRARAPVGDAGARSGRPSHGGDANRGPDARGVFVDADAGVSLGHTRLSIIDLSPAGAQPREHGGCARGTGAAARPSRRGADLAAAVAPVNAAGKKQMAAAPGALPPCAEAAGRTAEDGVSRCRSANGSEVPCAPGGGTLVGEAPCGGRAARPGAHRRAVARTSRPAPRLASVLVDGADVPGVARGEEDFN